MEKPDTLEVAAATAVPAKKATSHLPAIDGLRGLAAMGVVFIHCWVVNGLSTQPQFSVHGVTVPFYRLFIPGYSGVFLFFVLSGFCLSYPYFSNPDRPDNWPAYGFHRVRRILPAYMISFLALFLIGQWLHHVGNPVDPKFLYEGFKAKKFLKELFLIQQSRIVQSYWTLVLEWRWYLLFPVLLMAARRFSPVLVVAVACGVCYLAQIPAFAGPLDAATLGKVLTALPMFAFGIWAAQLSALAPERLQRWERLLVSYSHLGVIAGVGWCLAFCPPITNAPILKSVIAWSPLYFFLVVAAIKHPLFRKTLGVAPLAKLGTFSYSLYLLQEPLICAANRLLHHKEDGTWTLLLTNFLVIPLLCVLAGWAFFYIGERPFLKRSRQ